ncbi:hypothetical protein K250101E9_55570 [Enterocloster aldenensis]
MSGHPAMPGSPVSCGSLSMVRAAAAAGYFTYYYYDTKLIMRKEYPTRIIICTYL